MLENLLVSLSMKGSMRQITDLAFDSIDVDGSGGLDQSELEDIMLIVAKQIGVVPPTSEDLQNIMMQLDDDYDGIVSK